MNIRQELPHRTMQTLALGGVVFGWMMSGNRPEAVQGAQYQVQLGPSSYEVCKTTHVREGVIERCKTFVNDALTRLESDTTRTFTGVKDGHQVKDRYTLHRLTKYDPFGHRSMHYASCLLVRQVDGRPQPVTHCDLPAAELNQLQSPNEVPRPEQYLMV